MGMLYPEINEFHFSFYSKVKIKSLGLLIIVELSLNGSNSSGTYCGLSFGNQLNSIQCRKLQRFVTADFQHAFCYTFEHCERLHCPVSVNLLLRRLN